MVCSPEMLAANRKNAAKSTGPKTEQGKDRSRRNALKHGLTGEGVFVPDEDVEAIRGRFEAFEADLGPKGAVAAYLVGRVALLSVRMDRSARHESAEITHAMLGAEDFEAEARRLEIAGLGEALKGDDPAEALRKLRKSPEGFDWLIGQWRALAADLAVAKWTLYHQHRVGELLARKSQHPANPRIQLLTDVSNGGARLLKPEDWPGLDPLARAQAARDELKAILAAEIDRLERDRAGLDHEAIARDRATTPARALFDPSKAAILARKYEAAAAREFYKALKQVEQLDHRETTEEPASTEAANHDNETSSGESASFFSGPLKDRLAPPRSADLVASGPTAPPDRPQEPRRRRPDPARVRADR